MANYAGVAGTKQLTDRLGDETMEIVKKYLKLVREETGINVPVKAGGRFKISGEAALDKDNSLGVGVRAAAPNLGPEIPVNVDADVAVDRSAKGTVRADISYEFEVYADLSNVALAAIRRELLTDEDGNEVDPTEVRGPNRLGR